MSANETINPTKKSLAEALMPVRSAEVKEVRTYDPGTSTGSIGGFSDPNKGLAFVPSEENGESRTIRMHEVLHLDFTPRRKYLRDLLDQALEDARMHRYCSATTRIPYTTPRADELEMVARDLDRVEHVKPEPIVALTLLRCYGILASASDSSDIAERFVSVVKRIYGERFIKHAEKCLSILSAAKPKPAQWEDARKVMMRYFDTSRPEPKPKEDGEGDGEGKGKDKPKSKPEPKSSDDSLPSLPSEPSDEDAPTERSDSEGSESSDEPSEDGTEDSSTDEDEDEPSDADPKKSKSGASGGDGSHEDESSATEEDSEDAEEDEEDEDIEEEEDEEDSEELSDSHLPTIPPPIKKTLPKTAEHKRPYSAGTLGERYTGTFEHDDVDTEDLQRTWPIDLYIHRLDLAPSAVRTKGEDGERASRTGARVIASRLATARINPTQRIFRHRRGLAGGTILIDWSGSTGISATQLNDFCSLAPLATIAMYNAKSDTYDKSGNLWIYAADGKRARDLSQIEDHTRGGCNLIDYHSLVWLLRQGFPRYFVTDCEFTGYWESVAHQLTNKSIERGLVTVVPNLKKMMEILKTNSEGK